MKKTTPIIILCFLMLQFGNIYGQYCNEFEIEEIDFQAETKFVKVDAQWYPSWLEYHQGEIVYPDALEPLSKWKHPETSFPKIQRRS